MFRNILAAMPVAAVVLILTPTARAADNYTVDPRHTSVVFSVGHAGLSYTYGMFRESAGRYVIDKDNPNKSRFQFEIQADSIYTNDPERDTHLRGPDFFNVQQFPTINFETTACTMSNTPERGIEFLLTGNLTVHGVTRQVKVPMRMLAEGPGARRDQRTGFLCQLELKRSDYDMKNLLEDNIVGDAVSVTISFEGSLQAAPGTTPRPR